MRSSPWMSHNTLSGWAFILPYLIAFVPLLLWPFFRGIWISFHDWNLLAVTFNPSAKVFIGLENYVNLLWGDNLSWSLTQFPIFRLIVTGGALYFYWRAVQAAGFNRGRLITLLAVLFVSVVLLGLTGDWYDPRFWTVVRNTVVFVAIVVPATTLLALLLAIALNRPGRWAATMRSLFFFSQILSVTVVTLIWQLMYGVRNGFIANLLAPFNIASPNWLTDDSLAMGAIAFTTIWWSVGFALILFLAGLQQIPGDRLEAATLDGATGWRKLFYIIIPSIIRTVQFVMIMQIVLHFQVFGQSQLMTQGGPGDSTNVWVRYIYQSAFRDSEIGYASAMATLLFAFMLIFSVIQFWVTKRQES
ncbi:MAG: sugar ABC transporter permease [Saccharospirillum sp.]|nr:sugar ABC transporter permease [Saccharospirillum sp.]